MRTPIRDASAVTEPASAGPSAERRYLSLWLSHLSTDRLERAMPPAAREAPRATLAQERNALRLSALNGAARALGLTAGLSLADARARHPALAVEDHDAAADTRLLEAMADACERYTPLVALDGADGLMLDISGCAHLFGGEAELMRDLLRRTAQAGFCARAAVAGTPGAAFALARFCGKRSAMAPAGSDLARILAPLPLAALRLDAPTLAALARLGFTRIGDVQDKPRAPLAARFGSALADRLDEATGALRIALTHRFPPPCFSAERNLFEPIARTEDVLGLAEHLAAVLARSLERQGVGGRRFELALFRVDGQMTRLAVGTGRPVRHPSVVRRLFAEKLAAHDGLDAGFGFDLLRLTAPVAEPMVPEQGALERAFGAAEAAHAQADAEVGALVDRLAARFGGARIRTLAIADSHLPEAASAAMPALGTARHLTETALAEALDRLALAQPSEADADGPTRPLRLFSPPEPVEAVAAVPDGPPVRFRWRRMVHQVARCEGPERIAPPWWAESKLAAFAREAGTGSCEDSAAGQGNSAFPAPRETATGDGAEGSSLALTRDYFRVETQDGRRFWLFRAGLFGCEAEHPRWYLHGVFG